MNTLNRPIGVYPLPDLHPDTRTRLEAQAQDLLTKPLNQELFQRFGKHMILLMANVRSYQAGDYQRAEVFYSGDIETGDPLTVIAEKHTATGEVEFSFKDQDNAYMLAWRKDSAAAKLETQPHEEGIWATKDVLPPDQTLEWLSKALHAYENRSDWDRNEEWRRRGIVAHRIGKEAINPIGRRNSKIDEYGERVPVPVDEDYDVPEQKQNRLARLLKKSVKR